MPSGTARPSKPWSRSQTLRLTGQPSSCARSWSTTSSGGGSGCAIADHPRSLLGALQLRVYLATVLWALTIASLSVTEVWTLVWLSSHHPDAGDWSELAWLSVVSCALGVVLLFTVPTLRLLWFQVQIPRDLEPPDSYLRLLERKFGLSADASREERRAWLEGYHHGPLP